MRFADGVEVVGVDGDDTLWLCQDALDAAEATLVELLGPAFAERLEVVSRRNLRLYGYGVKAWTLNCLEAGGPLEQVLALGRELLSGPVELLPGTADAGDALAAAHRLVLVTKGDLVDQRRKLAASGLADRIDHLEIVADKDVAAYEDLLRLLIPGPQAHLSMSNTPLDGGCLA